MLLVDSILLLSPFVQTSPLAEEKVIPQASIMSVARLVVARVEEDPKVLEDLKSVSSAVRMIIGRVIVKRWMMARRIRRNETLDAYCARTCNNSDNSRDEKCSSDSFQVDPVCGTTVSPVQDDDECEAHAAFLVESEGFGVLDCGATTSLGSVEGAEACSPRITHMILEFQRLITQLWRWCFIKGYFSVQTSSPK